MRTIAVAVAGGISILAYVGAGGAGAAGIRVLAQRRKNLARGALRAMTQLLEDLRTI